MTIQPLSLPDLIHGVSTPRLSFSDFAFDVADLFFFKLLDRSEQLPSLAPGSKFPPLFMAANNSTLYTFEDTKAIISASRFLSPTQVLWYSKCLETMDKDALSKAGLKNPSTVHSWAQCIDLLHDTPWFKYAAAGRLASEASVQIYWEELSAFTSPSPRTFWTSDPPNSVSQIPLSVDLPGPIILFIALSEIALCRLFENTVEGVTHPLYRYCHWACGNHALKRMTWHSLVWSTCLKEDVSCYELDQLPLLEAKLRHQWNEARTWFLNWKQTNTDDETHSTDPLQWVRQWWRLANWLFPAPLDKNAKEGSAWKDCYLLEQNASDSVATLLQQRFDDVAKSYPVFIPE